MFHGPRHTLVCRALKGRPQHTLTAAHPLTVAPTPAHRRWINKTFIRWSMTQP